MKFFKKIILIILFSLINIHSQDSAQLKSRIDSFLSGNDFLQTTILAADVYDLSSVKSLYSLNNKLLLRPASNMKLLTSAAGILFLNDYTFRTSLFYTGEIINGTLLGDMYIKGGCDPAFSLADLDSMITSLKRMGIIEIAGNIFADVSYKDDQFWGKGWMWDDDPSPDAVYLSALNINNNVVNVSVFGDSTSERPQVKLDPASSYFSIDNKASGFTGYGEAETLSITRDWLNRSNNINITGSINITDTTERTVTVNVFNPSGYFLALFRERLDAHLITFNGNILESPVPSSAVENFVYQRPIDSILNTINKSSNNLAAEMVLYALAEKYFGKPASAKKGLLMIDSLIRLTGLNPAGYLLADGSGVSHYNLLSAELIMSVLKYLYYQRPELFNKLYSSLAVAGKDGTLMNRMNGTAAEGKVHGKTGTLTSVSCLSGYIDSVSGNVVAFSIMVQNFSGSPGYARYIQDELCRIISEY